MKRLLTIYLFILTALLSGCLPTKSISTIVSDTYDSKTNTTTFDEFPLGSVKIPGKWSKGTYNQASKQYFFRSADSVTVAIAINPSNRYSFYTKGITDNDFIKEYYEWDSKFLAEQIQGSRILISQDTSKHCILWRLTDNKDINSYFLFTIERGVVFNFYVSTIKWNEAEKIKFLNTLQDNKTAGNCCN